MTISQSVKNLFLLFITLLLVNFTFSQTTSLSGKISSSKESLVGVTVVLPELNIATSTDKTGNFRFNDIEEGKYLIQVSYIGFKTKKDSVTIQKGKNTIKDIVLQEDVLNMGEFVISGTRNEIERYKSPVIINTISPRTFEATQSLSISEGLNFSPGLRIENNCQNCGFTQLRMNGLEGAYSQILINSRPIFSALAGVYGLEMLPSNMIEKIEVVRGGGSVLYGGNAIAGTVNIITKDPFQNSFEIALNQSYIDFSTPDRTLTFNGSVVSDDLDKGITFFGFNKTRDPWDANNDGFSEVVKLENNTFGFNAFWNIDERKKLKLGAYYINEFRRGGNDFDLFPHQTALTEQLQHNILSSNISYEQYSEDYKHKFSVYGSFQMVDRVSYYGGGGRVIAEGDTLTEDDILAINAYGNSEDLSAVGGIQYNYEINNKLMLTTGAEYVYNDVRDEMPGYGRYIDQQVGTFGSYAQLEIKPIEKLTFLLGGRFDNVDINGLYNLKEENYTNKRMITVLVPRLSAMYNFKENLRLRASFAQGYRGPQAFDEDLHIETVGGSARFISIAPDLEMEKSNSALLSLNFDKTINNKQFNFVLEGFYTALNNPFILSDQVELDNGVAVITKRNGDKATVTGANIEANLALSSKLIFQSGYTFQKAVYSEEEEIWAPDDDNDPSSATRTKNLLRTPNNYGYFTLIYNPNKALSVAYSGVLTGSMDIAHVIDPETEKTIIKSTPNFFENNIKLSYTFTSKDNYKIQLFGGLQNIFNSYQKDFDIGAQRDAGYVYGPLRPRTIFMGLKFGLN